MSTNTAQDDKFNKQYTVMTGLLICVYNTTAFYISAGQIAMW